MTADPNRLTEHDALSAVPAVARDREASPPGRA
jgi:hypothetical protein